MFMEKDGEVEEKEEEEFDFLGLNPYWWCQLTCSDVSFSLFNMQFKNIL